MAGGHNMLTLWTQASLLAFKRSLLQQLCEPGCPLGVRYQHLSEMPTIRALVAVLITLWGAIVPAITDVHQLS
jgi:hypothetical protein